MFQLSRVGLNPYVIGHRGAKGYASENTLASFQKAADMGVDLVECDVHLTRDDHPVVMHDESVDRTTNGFGLVREMTLADIRNLQSREGEPIPTLSEVVDWVASRPRPHLVIELKQSPAIYPNIAERVVDLIVARQIVDRCVVISFDYSALEETKDLCRDLATGLLLGKRISDYIGTAREVQANSIWPALGLLNPNLVESAQDEGISVYTWTANQPKEMSRALTAGVDGIATDVPDLLQSVIHRWETRGETRAA